MNTLRIKHDVEGGLQALGAGTVAHCMQEYFLSMGLRCSCLFCIRQKIHYKVHLG